MVEYILRFLVYFLALHIDLCQLGTVDDDLVNNNVATSSDENDQNMFLKDDASCWMTLNAKHHFEKMDKLDRTYAKVRKDYHKAMEIKKFDKEMLLALVENRGMAHRAIQNVGSPKLIPAGIDLGGYSMMRMKGSVLFFHRVKLRNDTKFQVNYVHNDLENMFLTARLTLNDLHLVGTYERSTTDRDPSVLFFTPTYGQVEFLLKDVLYKMEGRYRLLNNRLFLELVISDIIVNDILMTYANKTSSSNSMRITRKNLNEFLAKLKADLDCWLRDYFNDYLIFLELQKSSSSPKFLEYDKKKAEALNEYVDKSLLSIRARLESLNATAVKLPSFSILSATSLQIKLSNGVLRGLDSIFRRSVATGRKIENIRKVDAIVGFSNLKVIYRYEALLTTGMPPLIGQLVLTADDLATLMSLSLLEEPETVELNFHFVKQIKPESLTVEGPANRMIANFKHLLELHIIAIMSNTLMHQIKLMSTLTRCQPALVGYDDPDDRLYEESKENKGASTGDGKPSGNYI